jgi:UDP-GlcNAc:undecaprenyl-phosphate GlcNAc-1-phosphate transferase
VLFTLLVRAFAIKYNLVAKPKQDRWHKKPTALLGGIAIYAASTLSFLLFSFNKNLLIWLIAPTVIFFVGIYDDFRKIRPYAKLLIQIFLSCIVVLSGFTFRIPKFPYLNIPLSIIWIVGITNSFNLLDNIDGLACGVAGISSLMLFLSSFLFTGLNYTSIQFLILAGASLGFLLFNFKPAKIFMGDSGSMFLGFSLATLSMVETTKHVTNLFTTLLIPVLILGVPIFDIIFVTLVRKIKGVNVFEGGIDHTSHRLVSLGLSERKTVLLLYFLSILFGLIAFSYSRFDMLIVSIFVVLTIIILLFFGIFLSEVETYKDDEIEKAREKKIKNGKVVLNTFILHKRRIVEVIIDFVLICIAYYSAYLLRFEGKISPANFDLIAKSLPWIIVIKFACFVYMGLYKGVWKYIGITDLISIFKAVSLGSILSIMFLTITFRFKEYSRVVSIIDWLLTLFFISGSRILLRILREYFLNISSTGKKILIMGAGDGGELALREIRNNKNLGYQVIGFVDDSGKKKNKRIHGIPVLGNREDIPRLINEYGIEELVIAIPSARDGDFRDILGKCREFDIVCRRLTRVMEFEEWKD